MCIHQLESLFEVDLVLAGVELRLTVSRCNRSRNCLVFFISLVSSKVQRRTKKGHSYNLGISMVPHQQWDR